MKTKTALLAPSILHDLPVQPPNGVHYAPSGHGWGEKGLKTEVAKAQNQPQKTRRIPVVH